MRKVEMTNDQIVEALDHWEVADFSIGEDDDGEMENCLVIEFCAAFRLSDGKFFQTEYQLPDSKEEKLLFLNWFSEKAKSRWMKGMDNNLESCIGSIEHIEG